MIIAELAERAGPSPHSLPLQATDPSAGVPKGVLSVVHGTIDPVNFLLDDPRVKAISFVGSDRAGKYIYERGCANGKRVQANLGAKSASLPPILLALPRLTKRDEDHCVVMPDASPNLALNSIAGAAFGAAGQRCMALSVMVTVGKSHEWVVPELVARAENLKVGNGFDDGVELSVSPSLARGLTGC